jgi:signal transduction histidine kinase
LGLALVRQFAALMGGEVGLESEVGRGSRFWVRLPRRPPQVAGSAESDSGREPAVRQDTAEASGEWCARAASVVPYSDLPRLLLADDDADMRDHVALLLRHQWRVTLAGNGREALSAINEALEYHDPFDVVIADVQMPEMDGLELVRHLKTDLPLRRLPMRRLPVVLLTAHSGPEAATVGQQGGADDYLAKPFSEAELKARLRAALHMHRVTRELDAANAVLQQSNDELREFAYVASHDLQEPLRKVQAFGNLLRAEYGPLLTGAGLDYLMRMEGAAERMQNLIRDLLSLSRVMTVNNSFAPIDLNRVMAEVLTDLEARALQSGAQITSTLLPTLEADAVQMRQLLQNLIGNALKFVSTDRVPQVMVTGEIVEGMCRLRVSDNGIGFEPTEAGAIFAPFCRLHARHNFDGTGIGLAICRKIVERHGGSIVAQGKPAVGATLMVSLPLRQQ